MKKTIITVCTLLTIGIIPFLYAQNQEKQYTVTLPIQQWQLVMDCLNKSNEEHLKVIAAQNLIVPQLQKQLADTTTKKPK